MRRSATFRSFVSALACLVLLGLASPSRAQEASGFGVSRFEPSERGSEWFALESLDLRGKFRPQIGIVAEYQYRTLAIYAPNGDVQTALVNHLLIAHAGASLVLFDRLRLAANLPLQLYGAGEAGSIGGVRYPAPSSDQSLGDLRLGADFRLVGSYGDAATLAVGAQVALPTGDKNAYAGDGDVRVIPRLTLAGDIGSFAYGVKAGVQYRARSESFAATPIGTELVFGASLGLRAAHRNLLVGPEIYGSTVTDGDQLFGRRTTPVEALLGAHYTFFDVRLGAGVGTGLTRGYGTPLVHALVSLEWINAPSTRDGDRDGDGIADSGDACPDTPGVANADPSKNGCPPSDRDRDGILDEVDACPDVPGVASSDPTIHGCPPSDRDHDGIVDTTDACPDVPGPPNADAAKNGCPKAYVSGDQIVILDQVKFKTSSADILPGKDSEDVLEAVLAVLKEHPEIQHLRVEGHTDNRGNAAMNKRLSAARASSVRTWLVGHGIEAPRLSSAGFGFERPRDTNSTEEGRHNNRRVEFHIDGGPPGANAPRSKAPASKRKK